MEDRDSFKVNQQQDQQILRWNMERAKTADNKDVARRRPSLRKQQSSHYFDSCASSDSGNGNSASGNCSTSRISGVLSSSSASAIRSISSSTSSAAFVVSSASSTASSTPSTGCSLSAPSSSSSSNGYAMQSNNPPQPRMSVGSSLATTNLAFSSASSIMKTTTTRDTIITNNRRGIVPLSSSSVDSAHQLISARAQNDQIYASDRLDDEIKFAPTTINSRFLSEAPSARKRRVFAVRSETMSSSFDAIEDDNEENIEDNSIENTESFESQHIFERQTIEETNDSLNEGEEMDDELLPTLQSSPRSLCSLPKISDSSKRCKNNIEFDDRNQLEEKSSLLLGADNIYLDSSIVDLNVENRLVNIELSLNCRQSLLDSLQKVFLDQKGKKLRCKLVINRNEVGNQNGESSPLSSTQLSIFSSRLSFDTSPSSTSSSSSSSKLCSSSSVSSTTSESSLSQSNDRKKTKKKKKKKKKKSSKPKRYRNNFWKLVASDSSSFDSNKDEYADKKDDVDCNIAIERTEVDRNHSEIPEMLREDQEESEIIDINNKEQRTEQNSNCKLAAFIDNELDIDDDRPKLLYLDENFEALIASADQCQQQSLVTSSSSQHHQQQQPLQRLNSIDEEDNINVNKYRNNKLGENKDDEEEDEEETIDQSDEYFDDDDLLFSNISPNISQQHRQQHTSQQHSLAQLRSSPTNTSLIDQTDLKRHSRSRSALLPIVRSSQQTQTKFPTNHIPTSQPFNGRPVFVWSPRARRVSCPAGSSLSFSSWNQWLVAPSRLCASCYKTLDNQTQPPRPAPRRKQSSSAQSSGKGSSRPSLANSDYFSSFDQSDATNCSQSQPQQPLQQQQHHYHHVSHQQQCHREVPWLSGFPAGPNDSLQRYQQQQQLAAELRRQSTITGFDHRRYLAARSPSLCLPQASTARTRQQMQQLQRINPAASAGPWSSQVTHEPSQYSRCCSPCASPSPTFAANNQTTLGSIIQLQQQQQQQYPAGRVFARPRLESLESDRSSPTWTASSLSLRSTSICNSITNNYAYQAQSGKKYPAESKFCVSNPIGYAPLQVGSSCFNSNMQNHVPVYYFLCCCPSGPKSASPPPPQQATNERENTSRQGISSANNEQPATSSVVPTAGASSVRADGTSQQLSQSSRQALQSEMNSCRQVDGQKQFNKAHQECENEDNEENECSSIEIEDDTKQSGDKDNNCSQGKKEKKVLLDDKLLALLAAVDCATTTTTTTTTPTPTTTDIATTASSTISSSCIANCGSPDSQALLRAKLAELRQRINAAERLLDNSLATPSECNAEGLASVNKATTTTTTTTATTDQPSRRQPASLVRYSSSSLLLTSNFENLIKQREKRSIDDKLANEREEAWFLSSSPIGAKSANNSSTQVRNASRESLSFASSRHSRSGSAPKVSTSLSARENALRRQSTSSQCKLSSNTCFREQQERVEFLQQRQQQQQQKHMRQQSNEHNDRVCQNNDQNVQQNSQSDYMQLPILSTSTTTTTTATDSKSLAQAKYLYSTLTSNSKALLAASSIQRTQVSGSSPTRNHEIGTTSRRRQLAAKAKAKAKSKLKAKFNKQTATDAIDVKNNNQRLLGSFNLNETQYETLTTNPDYHQFQVPIITHANLNATSDTKKCQKQSELTTGRRRGDEPSDDDDNDDDDDVGNSSSSETVASDTDEFSFGAKKVSDSEDDEEKNDDFEYQQGRGGVGMHQIDLNSNNKGGDRRDSQTLLDLPSLDSAQHALRAQGADLDTGNGNFIMATRRRRSVHVVQQQIQQQLQMGVVGGMQSKRMTSFGLLSPSSSPSGQQQQESVFNLPTKPTARLATSASIDTAHMTPLTTRSSLASASSMRVLRTRFRSDPATERHSYTSSQRSSLTIALASSQSPHTVVSSSSSSAAAANETTTDVGASQSLTPDVSPVIEAGGVSRNVGRIFKAANSESEFDIDELESCNSTLLSELGTWNYPIFDLHSYCGRSILSKLSYRIFSDSGFFESFNIPKQQFFNFFHSLENGYHDKPSMTCFDENKKDHNRLHAADVLHAVYYLTSQPIDNFCQVPLNLIEHYDDLLLSTSECSFQTIKTKSTTNMDDINNFDNKIDPNEVTCDDGSLRSHIVAVVVAAAAAAADSELPFGVMAANLTALEVMALYTAAAMHDFQHPGRTNSFLVATNSSLALLYNDRSVLENHHAAAAWALFYSGQHFNWLCNLEKDEFKRFRFMIIELILATDLMRHYELVSAFNKKLSDVGRHNIDWFCESDRLLVMEIIIKLADVNGPMKAHALHCTWTERIAREFYEQGDEERALNLPVSLYMDRSDPRLPELQKSFINHLVGPLSHSYSAAGFFPIADSETASVELDEADEIIGDESSNQRRPSQSLNNNSNLKQNEESVQSQTKYWLIENQNELNKQFLKCKQTMNLRKNFQYWNKLSMEQQKETSTTKNDT